MRAFSRFALTSFAALPLLSLWACGGGEGPTGKPVTMPESTITGTAPTPKSPLAPKLLGLPSDDEAALDRSVSPCDDFFQFACGGWLQKTSIPDDEATWMRSFSVIRESNEKILKEILEGYASGAGRGEPNAKALGDFYGSCMDEAAIDKAGAQPLQADLRAIDALKDATGIAKLAAAFHAREIPVFFNVGAQQDFTDSTKMIGAFDQAGLGLPDRDYYLKGDGKFPELRAKYEKHVAAMLKLLGSRTPEADAKGVLEIEKLLASAQMSKEDRRDPKKVYHLTQKADLKTVAPQFAWDAYLAGLPLGKAAQFNVAQPDYLKTVGQLLSSGSTPITAWRAYFKWHLVHQAAGTLSAPFVQENFQWQKALVGTPALPPRWKRCVRRTDAALGEALAQPFVKKTLGAEGKQNTLALVHAIEGEMKRNIESIAWMDKKTKELAFAKLAKIANQIAFPDKWRSYDALSIQKGAFFKNVQNANVFEARRVLAKISKPVDRQEWFMTPPTVNAYYDPSMNQMVFPAGILQPPFYANTAHPATNYGAIGMVMGHELTHGFDDEGRQFDADGNLKDWWTAETNAEFERRVSCVEKQFDGYEVLGEKLNGKLTLGENIADLGGIKLSFAALVQYAAAHPFTPAGPDAATPEQRFYLGYAHAWCGKSRDETMRVRIATDPHSPPAQRVNGPLSNLPTFAKAFSCTRGQPMARKDACEVW